jgi:hypothetical protein
MAKRVRPPAPVSSAVAKPGARPPRPGIVHTSVYLPEAVYETLRAAGIQGAPQNPRPHVGRDRAGTAQAGAAELSAKPAVVSRE